MEPVVNGAWMVSETRFGPLVHARLGVAEDNSGKLVTLVRNEARRVAEERGLPLVIVDGSPGIGCPVISSLAGADLVLAVTEPTVSGRHDLDRVLQVVRQFRLPFAVCVNKADLNPELGEQIAGEATAAGAAFVASVAYDPAVTHAQVAGTDIIDYGGRAATEITEVWEAVGDALLAVAGGAGATGSRQHRPGGMRPDDVTHGRTAARVRTRPVTAARPLTRRRPRAAQDVHLRLRVLPARAHDEQDGAARSLGRPGRRGRPGARQAVVRSPTSSHSRDRANPRSTQGSATSSTGSRRSRTCPWRSSPTGRSSAARRCAATWPRRTSCCRPWTLPARSCSGG